MECERRQEPLEVRSARACRIPHRTGSPPGRAAGSTLVFRDTDLSDRIGFTYQNYTGEEGAEDFVRAVLDRAPPRGGSDVLLTVILDGENAWEHYAKDMDGKQFIAALYRKLEHLSASAADHHDDDCRSISQGTPKEGSPHIPWPLFRQ